MKTGKIKSFAVIVFLWLLLFCFVNKCAAQEKFFVVTRRQRVTLDSMFTKVNYGKGETQFVPVQLLDTSYYVLPEAVGNSVSFRGYAAAGREKYLFDQIFLY